MLRSFLGLIEYYCQFIQGLSSIATPLTRLTRKDKCFVWTDKCESSFKTLKERLTSVPALTLPAGHDDFMVYTYASRVSLGYVLMQRDKVIVYASVS